MYAFTSSFTKKLKLNTQFLFCKNSDIILQISGLVMMQVFPHPLIVGVDEEIMSIIDPISISYVPSNHSRQFFDVIYFLNNFPNNQLRQNVSS